MRIYHFRAQNDSFDLNKIVLVQTIVITYIYLLALFFAQKLNKNLQRAQSYDDAPNNSFLKIIVIIFICLLASFIPQNLKQIFPADPELNVQFLGPAWTIPSNENSFRKPVNEPCFFHLCLPSCQKSKSDINLLVEYWWLKNTELSLAECHFSL